MLFLPTGLQQSGKGRFDCPDDALQISGNRGYKASMELQPPLLR